MAERVADIWVSAFAICGKECFVSELTPRLSVGQVGRMEWTFCRCERYGNVDREPTPLARLLGVFHNACAFQGPTDNYGYGSTTSANPS